MLRTIRRSVFKDINADDIANAVKLYTSAQSVTERQTLFEDMYTIRLSLYTINKSLISKTAKCIKNNPQVKQYPELIELFKKNNIFVNHTEKARKIVDNIAYE